MNTALRIRHLSRAGRATRAVASFVLSAAMVSGGLAAPASVAALAPVGQGFTVSPADLAFILRQIKIAEAHVANTIGSTDPCGALVGPGPDQIASPLVSEGLRTVDGTCNNLLPGQETFGAADRAFPRLTTPVFGAAEDASAFGGPVSSSYAQTSGNVADSEPRTISNLIVDQTSTNPAAVAAAGFPIRSQGNEGVVPCTTEPKTPGGTDGLPIGCVPAHVTLDIPNVTTDVGLSPPFNSLFTIFGQFFDHGLDKITNGGSGLVFVPLKADDPLITLGPDGIPGNGDKVPANQAFMLLTRGSIVTGPDGHRSSPNTDTPFVDQSQTYTSHASHQVFLREYVNNSVGKPVATGKFLSSADGGLATWAMIKAQAATLLGLQLVDVDVNNIPMIAADAYGKFIPGPDRGLPQYVTGSGLIEGDTTTPVLVPANALRIGTAFLNDIAHSAGPGSIALPKTPDGNLAAGGSLDPVATGEYDNELLDIHFICGDGRCNENIALSAIHQVFHTEHDRLVGYIQNVLATDTSGITNLADWQTALGAPGTPAPWNGERLFQAARFVTEMEYQHLVFEEFARKIQPGINPFEPFAFNQTDVNPAITAEFAHAVYRFGHSMLTDSIPRLNEDGTHFDIALLDGFLNPAAYNDGGRLSSEQAAGSIIMGLSDQVGQEIDEFVNETLRNNLLGLPLDLPTINMTRARSEGIPSLNNVRRQIFNATNDGQLTPYTDWVDFGQVLKHPESLVNFIAAYGTHPTIASQTTLAGRRTAADQIVNGTILPGPDGTLGGLDDILPPTDAADFMFSTGLFANAGTTSLTGLDDIDLWVGGLAERTNLFGGLLGTTFNYVFENQLTNLQNGDRLYYLARTPGMNLRAQLEGNSFAELVMRNTNAHTLKADPFATADCKFELGRITFPAAAGSFITGAGSVQNDPLSECDENRLLLNSPTWQVRYRAVNSVDPVGINGQSVYNGTLSVDRIYGGNDSDTFWGGLGNDIIEGGDGADIALGGEGNDIITDLAGDDVPKGGPGNDAIDGGPGLDIIMGGDGNDFTNGGANTNETFLGAGDDFAIAGQGLDAVFGDSGDDWEEGGDQPDLLIGDSSSLFFDDHNLPGHDILIGQGGDDDYDLEGGDDIGVAGPGVEKIAGASGYDWEIGLADPQAQDMDLAQVFVAGGVILPGVRDKFNEVEALSGWDFADTLRGDSIVPTAVGGGGFVGCDALDAAGVARIVGLDALVPASSLTVPSAPIIAASATHHCLLTGNVWGDGNILLGGAGSDTLEGRGANDILDGDKYLNVRLSIRANPDGTGAEIATSTLMETIPTGSGWTGPLAGKTLQQAVFAGLVDPGNIVAVREILNPGDGTSTDTALYSGPRSNYTLTRNANGSVTVADNAAVVAAGDGTDTLWNIETLSFCDVPDPVVKGACVTRAAPFATSSIALAAPIAGRSPASLPFGNQVIATVSATQAITVSNTGNAPLQVGPVTLVGANPTQFTIAANGCATVAPAGSCTIDVVFAPTVPFTGGPKSASVSIANNDVLHSPLLVTLTGTALALPAPIAVVAPAALAFGNRAVSTSTTLPITVTNTGTATLNVTGATVTGDAASFPIANGCTTPVAPTASCTINVTFLAGATAGVTSSASLSIAHDAAGSPTTVPLSGTSVAPLTTFSLPAGPIAFGKRAITTNTTKTVLVTNTGANPLFVTSANAAAPFATVTLGTCSAPVAAGKTCKLNVTFTPTARTAYAVTLTVVSSNATNSPRTVGLTGTGK